MGTATTWLAIATTWMAVATTWLAVATMPPLRLPHVWPPQRSHARPSGACARGRWGWGAAAWRPSPSGTPVCSPEPPGAGGWAAVPGRAGGGRGRPGSAAGRDRERRERGPRGREAPRALLQPQLAAAAATHHGSIRQSSMQHSACTSPYTLPAYSAISPPLKYEH